MICAYDESYIVGAQRILGDMYDYAVNKMKYSLSEFQKLFLVSPISREFAKGNPMYVAGMNGCEVAKCVIEDCTGHRPVLADEMEMDKSPEYWIGWSLAYYQWERDISFKEIEAACPVEEMYGMYKTLHEADISLFIDVVDEKMSKYKMESSLRRLRRYAEMTQKYLAETSDVPLRQIQLFEQGQRDIKKCQAQTVKQLAKTMKCSIEDLL